jgi:cytosine/adenosine deaminase-related metal-dependent hydrolase
MGSILIRSATVLTMDPARSIHADGAVLIESGRIAYVGAAAGVPTRGADQIVDARGRARSQGPRGQSLTGDDRRHPL